jgi:hypothetical protein
MKRYIFLFIIVINLTNLFILFFFDIITIVRLTEIWTNLLYFTVFVLRHFISYFISFHFTFSRYQKVITGPAWSLGNDPRPGVNEEKEEGKIFTEYEEKSGREVKWGSVKGKEKGVSWALGAIGEETLTPAARMMREYSMAYSGVGEDEELDLQPNVAAQSK